MRLSPIGLALTCTLILTPAVAASPRGGSVTTITTIQKGTAFTAIDVDHDGKPSIGDVTIAEVVHVSPKTGKRIGAGTAVCTQINAAGTHFDCQGEDHFAAGELREAGSFTVSKGFRLAILGGTGAYQGASGELEGTWLDSKLTKAHDVFTIRKP